MHDIIPFPFPTAAQFEVSQSELELYKEKFTRQERQLKEAKDKQAAIHTELQDKKKQEAGIEKVLPKKRKDLQKSESELKVVEETFEKLTRQLREGRGRVEEARSALESHKKRGQVLECLMQQRDAGNIPGICGRLVSVFGKGSTPP